MSSPADPVRALMHRHRELCERAVDPLEIAAGLEAHGVTDRTAASFRHRDVFSLAEELYARVPRAEASHGDAGAAAGRGTDGAVPSGESHVAGGPVAEPRHRWWWLSDYLLPLLPGALCAATLTGLAALPDIAQSFQAARVAQQPWLTLDSARCAMTAAGIVLTLVAARFALCRRSPPGVAGLWALVLLGHSFFGLALLAGLLRGGPPPAPPGAASVMALTLALAVAPAAWCARWFARRGRLRLAVSRSLRELAAGIRPLLAATVVLFTAALLVIHVLLFSSRSPLPPFLSPRPPAIVPAVEPVVTVATITLGVLLFLAVLLVAHGFRRVAAIGLGAACTAQTMVLAVAAASWLPGLTFLGRPVDILVGAHGLAAVPALVCGSAATVLLVRGAGVLAGARAHHRAASP